MVKWAVGIRLSGVTDADVESALDGGEILRTHVLRPTWHLVTLEDIRWMLELTAPNIKKLTKGRHRYLELTPAIFSKCRRLLEKTLRDGNHSTREELIPLLNNANIATDENRASHIFMELELDGVICSGKIKNGKQTFALLDERVPQTKHINKEEALAMLARKYFSSHCPAQLDDFVWWSGLPVKEARQAIENVRTDFMMETVEAKTYWLSEKFSTPKNDTAFLLPAYDEFIISYADRSATLTFTNQKRTVSTNGIFRATVVINGETIGVWKRSFKKDNVSLEFEYFSKPDKSMLKMIDTEALRYAKFVGKNLTTDN
jgi:hypothetical protein